MRVPKRSLRQVWNVVILLTPGRTTKAVRELHRFDTGGCVPRSDDFGAVRIQGAAYRLIG